MVVTIGRAWLPLYVTALTPDAPPDDPV